MSSLPRDVERALRARVRAHNRRVPATRCATSALAQAVYSRGAGELSGSESSGLARVDAFLRVLASDAESAPRGFADVDLLPRSHPASLSGAHVGGRTRARAEVTLSSPAVLDELERVRPGVTASLTVPDEMTPEQALSLMARVLGAPTELHPALRAAWLRAVAANEQPLPRATALAAGAGDRDTDLLPEWFRTSRRSAE